MILESKLVLTFRCIVNRSSSSKKLILEHLLALSFVNGSLRIFLEPLFSFMNNSVRNLSELAKIFSKTRIWGPNKRWNSRKKGGQSPTNKSLHYTSFRSALGSKTKLSVVHFPQKWFQKYAQVFKEIDGKISMQGWAEIWSLRRFRRACRAPIDGD